MPLPRIWAVLLPLASLAAIPQSAVRAGDATGVQQATGPATQPATVPSMRTSGLVERLMAAPAAEEGEGVVARFDKATLTREQLVEFLVQTRGLDALLNLMQFQIARDLAQQEGINVTPQDIEREKLETLRQALAGVQDVTEDQYDELLAQLLARQQLSQAEFDLVIATNAYLKALARPRIERQLTDENLRKAFAIRYGEQVRVRHIAVDNPQQAAEVRQRLEAGEEFAAVAAQVSRNPQTKQSGGLLPPFSMQSDLPAAFKQAAFELEVGQVSQTVEAGDQYHLIRLEERIPPTAVEFENVRGELRRQVLEEQALVVTAELRRQIAQALGSGNLQVSDPVLAQQLDQRIAALRPQPMDPEALKRQEAARRPATGPTTAPATAPATGPGDKSSGQPPSD